MCLCQKLAQKLLLLKGIDQFTGFLLIRQFRIAEDIVGAAGIDLQILLRPNGLGHRVNDLADDSSVDTCLLLHHRYHGQIDLIDGQAV